MKKNRGFTLVELMVTLGISGILGTVFSSVIYSQTRSYFDRAEDLTVQQNGMAILDDMRRSLRVAGSGMVNQAEATGDPAIGGCWVITGAQMDPRYNGGSYNRNYNCTSDVTGDAMRTISGRWPPYYSLLTYSASVASRNICSGDDWNTVGLRQQDQKGLGDMPLSTSLTYPGGTLLISGRCTNDNPNAYVNKALTFYNAVPGLPPCAGAYTAFNDGVGYFGMPCNEGFDPGYHLLAMSTSSYGLPVGVDPNSRNVDDNVTPNGMENLQIRYGFDTSVPLDGRIDTCPTCTEDPLGAEDGGPYAWCRDPRASDLGGPCRQTDSNGVAIDSQGLRNRIVVAHVSFTIRSDSKRPVNAAMGVDPDGYKRWHFSTFVSLRSRVGI